MIFPNIISKQTVRTTIGNFGGLNQQEIIEANEFADMKNISSIMLPGLTNRPERGPVLKSLTAPHGLYWKNGLFYVDGTKAYYKDQEVFTVTDTDKTIIGMGAYIIIYPDKMVYNTHTGEVSEMEAKFEQTAELTIAPVSAGSTFVKISGYGIGKKFHNGDGVTLAGFTKYADVLNVSKIIQSREDDSITVIAAGVESFQQQSGVSITRTAPDLDFICEHNNRLWGCSSKNHEIYASKLGDPLNWNCFEGLSTDSYALTVGSDGDFTGCLSHGGYVVFFKEDVIHTIFGSRPSSYSLDTVQARGPAKGCEKSLCRVDESLFYVGRDAVLEYDGSIPEEVSQKLRGEFTAASGNQYDGKYYLSRKEASGWRLYVYDVKRETWYIEDGTEIKYSVYAEGKLYIIDGGKQLREIYNGETLKDGTMQEWELVSGEQEEGTIQKKKLHKLLFSVDLEQEAVFEVYLQCDNEAAWRRVAAITADQRRTYSVPIKLRRCERFRYKLHGYGRFKLYAIVQEYGGGSDK